jgi:two-component system, OmpR family, sensor kinase
MRVAGLARPGLRGRLLLSVVGAIALVLAMLTAGFNLVLDDRLDRDANNVAVARASAEVAALRVVNGHIALPEAPDESALDSEIWVFDGRRLLERPRSGAANNRAATALATGGRRFRDVGDTRLYLAPVVQHGRRIGAVVAGVSLKPYRESKRTALFASVVLAALALAAVAIATWWLISRALRPVARMTRQAAEWSDRDLDRRFSLGQPHDELTQLASTLDGLLDRLAASLRREQRFSAELSHELRTPLANVIAEAQFALRHAEGPEDHRAGFEQVLQSARQMSRTLETLIVAARAELDPRHATSDANTSARAAIDGCAALAAQRGVEIALVSPRALVRVAAEPDLVERILTPLLENACRYARQDVRVTVRAIEGTVVYTVEDDGPGVAAQDREAIFEPGRRGASAEPGGVATHGAGLGLALCRRLARSAGGEVEAGGSDAGGRFLVRLPAG